MNLQSVASRAKELIQTASRNLGTANAAGELGPVLDAWRPAPPEDPRYRQLRVFEPGYAEPGSRSLNVLMSAGGPSDSEPDRAERAIYTVRQVVGRNFGPDALRWLDARLEPYGQRERRRVTWGGWFGGGFDRDGMFETEVTLQWGPGLLDALPPRLFRIARTAMDALPRLVPALSTIRCGRYRGSQQLTFDVDFALSLSDLKPLMERLGLGHRHGGLMSAAALVLGARFTLPPGSATLTLRPMREGVELRLDVYLDQIPDLPESMVSLLRLQMAERPRSLRSLDRWMLALTPEGFDQPGRLSVLSVGATAQTAARIALYLRPASLETDSADQETGADVTAPSESPLAEAPA